MVINAQTKRIKYKEEEVPAGTNGVCMCMPVKEREKKGGDWLEIYLEKMQSALNVHSNLFHTLLKHHFSV